nr:putative late blight resistance protein homolog R1B-14 isoform X1 [Ipomoea batatas]
MKVWLQAILEECETIMGIGTLKEMVREIEEVEERILMIKRGTDLDPDEGVWDTYQSALELENEVISKKDLQSLYWLKVASSDEKPNFGMVPNLMELGIYIEGQLAPSHLGSLVHLHLLEKLKFEVVAIIGRKGSKATPIPPAWPSSPVHRSVMTRSQFPEPATNLVSESDVMSNYASAESVLEGLSLTLGYLDA